MNYRSVLAAVPVGADEKVPISSIAKLTNLSYRQVSEIIFNLRVQYSVPIVSSRSIKDGGVFIAVNEEQRKIGLAAYSRQINSMSKSYEILSKCDLNSWRGLMRHNLISFNDNEVADNSAG